MANTRQMAMTHQLEINLGERVSASGEADCRFAHCFLAARWFAVRRYATAPPTHCIVLYTATYRAASLGVLQSAPSIQ